jgi:anhydro-N-acetylmuramic acid kinase
MSNTSAGLYLGLMSGTSMDGIDVALVRTDGSRELERFPKDTLFVPYTDDERDFIRRAVDLCARQGRRFKDRFERPVALDNAEEAITHAHVGAVRRFLETRPLKIRAIGFHGHTVLHQPHRIPSMTIQLGKADVLAKAIGIPVIADFRANDIASGGEGAPLVPVYHAVLIRQSNLKLPIAVLNLGGVANLTYRDEGHLIAADIGPGNALIDDCMWKHFKKRFDDKGSFARQGRVNESALAYALGEAFFDKPFPKSLDRQAFHKVPSVQAILALAPRDALATLTALTVGCVVRAVQHLPRPPQRWIVCGGGAHNTFLMAMLKHALDVPVQDGSEFGWSNDFMEAEAFAYLAARSEANLPLSFPQTTGVMEPCLGGVRFKA